MHLEQINICNFRVFEKLDLTLNPGLNILVGENDSGKTAIIDAIRYTLGTNSAERQYIDESDFHNDSAALTIQLKFVSLDRHAHMFVEHLTHEEFTRSDGTKTQRAVLYVQLTAQKTGLEKRGYPFIRSELKSGKDGNGLPIESEIRDFLSTTYLKPLRDAEEELASGRGSRLSQILNSSKDLITPTSVDEILGHIGEANSKLLAAGKPINLTSLKIRDDYLHKLIFDEDRTLISAIIDIAGIKSEKLPNLTESQKRKHLRVVLEGLNLALTEDRKRHGLGYHNLLFMAAELLLLEQELDLEFPLLLIEEPEAHLHPQLQMKLLQFIISKVKTQSNVNGIQCLVSTHSPNISSKADPSDVILLSKGKAFSLRPDETELSKDDYVFLRKFLDVTKANAFFARGVIFVEGDGENILLPTLAKLIGKPLEDHGVAIVRYDNNGSWKRFVKLFLRKGMDGDATRWNPVRVAVARDLDLWPLCAERTLTNPYGHLERKLPSAQNQGGNLAYWEDAANLDNQISAKKIVIKSQEGSSLERQNVKIFVSDRWTFEFCLARFGLFNESYQAVTGDDQEAANITGNDDEKATYIQSQVAKTDFAYKLADILENAFEKVVIEAIAMLPAEEQKSLESKNQIIREQQAALRSRLPPYIVELIDYVTPIAAPQVVPAGSPATTPIPTSAGTPDVTTA
jgi:putative ATP-dependent endonuclease of OLD family